MLVIWSFWQVMTFQFVNRSKGFRLFLVLWIFSICDNKNQEDVCTPEQVVSFISAWDEHFYHHFGVHLQV